MGAFSRQDLLQIAQENSISALSSMDDGSIYLLAAKLWQWSPCPSSSADEHCQRA